jgi:hypothetical protein
VLFYCPAPALAGAGYAPVLFLKSGGAGENPAPTVKVWMGEEFDVLFCCALFSQARLLSFRSNEMKIIWCVFAMKKRSFNPL